jgi:hypothetical protein
MATTKASTGEKVKIKLFKDNNNYKDDVYVAVNGHAFLIQRGVEVEVPPYIAEVLQNAEEQRIRADEVMSDMTSRYQLAE